MICYIIVLLLVKASDITSNLVKTKHKKLSSMHQSRTYSKTSCKVTKIHRW